MQQVQRATGVEAVAVRADAAHRDDARAPSRPGPAVAGRAAPRRAVGELLAIPQAGRRGDDPGAAAGAGCAYPSLSQL